MLHATAVLAVFLLAACDRPQEETIEAVPPPSAQAANSLMAEAERAAANAQSRSSSNQQGNTQ